jgi:hypothetical protein
MSGTGAPGGGSAIRVFTDSPLSGANAARMMGAPGPQYIQVR